MYLIVNQKLSGLIMFNKKNMMLVTLLSFVISCGNNKELQIDEIINAAVKNPLRKIENTEKDELNKPVEILKFAELSSDMTVLNLSPVDEFYNELLNNVINEDKNGLVIDAGIDNLNSNKSSLDRVFMIENYHKLYSEFSGSKADAVQMFLKKVRHALKPGGLVIIIDHDAEKGSSIATASSINRLSDEIVMSDMKNAGFEFVDNIHILKDDWEDDLTISAFDPSVIGSTSRFVHKYRSPN
tara:strand:- start:137 stop:859 length:723 start_codon:yes stop_codon:yes gene_type:complete